MEAQQLPLQVHTHFSPAWPSLLLVVAVDGGHDCWIPVAPLAVGGDGVESLQRSQVGPRQHAAASTALWRTPGGAHTQEPPPQGRPFLASPAHPPGRPKTRDSRCTREPHGTDSRPGAGTAATCGRDHELSSQRRRGSGSPAAVPVSVPLTCLRGGVVEPAGVVPHGGGLGEVVQQERVLGPGVGPTHACRQQQGQGSGRWRQDQAHLTIPHTQSAAARVQPTCTCQH